MPFDQPILLTMLAAMALLVRVGMAMYAGGIVRSKNAASAIFRSVRDLCVASVAYWAIGAAFYGSPGKLLGFNPRLICDWSGQADARTFTHLALVLIATGIVSPVLSERVKLLPLCFVSVILAGIIVPIEAASHMRLSPRFIDIGGAAVLHVAGAVAALVGAIFVGPRAGKYNRDGSSSMIPAHNVPLVSAGVLVMLVGWFPYLFAAGAVHALVSPRIALNVLLAAAAGFVVAAALCRIRYGKPDVLLTYGGMLGGLVAICAAPHVISTGSAVIVGAIAGFLVPSAIVHLDLVHKIDDPAGAIAIHGVGGLWGIIAAAIFIPNSLSGKLHQLGWQALGTLVVAVFVAVCTIALFAALKATIGLRATEADEYDGLDLAEHDLNAYPDFQQTMIKSYHMREA
jgi:Amt family ammonium transporter